MTRIVGRPPYRFVETPDGKGKYQRIERATAEEKARAIAWYLEKHRGRKPGEKEWFTHPVSAQVRVTVEMDTGYAWRITLLDRPTARYEFKQAAYGRRVSHKISMRETQVVDRGDGEVLGRYRLYGRFPPWFWLSLGTPGFACDAPERWPLTRGSFSIYRQVLEPAIRE